MFATARNSVSRWFRSASAADTASYSRMTRVANFANTDIESPNDVLATQSVPDQQKEQMTAHSNNRTRQQTFLSGSCALLSAILVLQIVQIGVVLYAGVRFGPTVASAVEKIHDVIDRNQFVQAALSVEDEIIPALKRLLPTISNLPQFVNATQTTLDDFRQQVIEVKDLLAAHFHW